MKWLSLIFLFISSISYGVNCNKHPIYCKIIKLNKNIDKKFAMKLSNEIYRKAKKYKTNPKISIAIAMQESGINNINRYSKSVSAACVVDKVMCEPHKVISDIGIFQIHVITAQHYNLDIYRLLTDIEYQVESHMKILRDKIKLCKKKKIKETWSCYHSITPKYRNTYVKAVKRYIH